MADHAEQLKAKLEAADEFPPAEETEVREQIALWRAFREGNRDVLADEVDWNTEEYADANGVVRLRPRQRRYLLDPLAERIAETWGDLLFGEDPTIIAAGETNQERLDLIVEENDLPSGLQEAAEVCAGEGEVWWSVYKDATALSVPTIDWNSRLDVIPYWIGRKLCAVAFVSELARVDSDGRETVWRYIKIHEEGRVLNLLYRGEDQTLGPERELNARVETEDLPPVWEHRLPSMLAGRVVNKRAPKNGSRSVYDGIQDLLLALNENLSIGQENARLTGKKRAVVPSRYLDADGNFPAGAEILIATEMDQGDDDKPEGLTLLEWEFDADALKLWIDHLEGQACTRARIAPQLIGKATENALTGPALRARLLDTVLGAHGKGRFWDDQLPQALAAAQMVDALPEHDGGFGSQWTNPSEPPSVERGDVLPKDIEAETRLHMEAVAAELESRETAVREMHPDWSDKRVAEELAAIAREVSSEIAPPEGEGEEALV